MYKCPEADQCSTDIDEHLDNVCPDDGGHSTFECVNESECGHNEYRNPYAGRFRHVEQKIFVQCDVHDDGNRKDTHAFRKRSSTEKCSGGETVDAFTESTIHQFISGEQ